MSPTKNTKFDVPLLQNYCYLDSMRVRILQKEEIIELLHTFLTAKIYNNKINLLKY